MDTESSTQLTEAARAAGAALDPALLLRIDAALAATRDGAETGRLHLARAIALQGSGDPARISEAARRAVPHLAAAGQLGTAALASAVAAAGAVQLDELALAVELVVDAVVMLGDVAEDEVDSLRAALALAAFFARLSAITLSISWARRAFEGARRLPGIRVDAAAYSYGYICAEGAHVSPDDAVRVERVAAALLAADWLVEHGGSAVSRVLLAGGISADARLAAGELVDPAELDAGVELYDGSGPDVVAWHQLVRATAHLRRGDAVAALDLLDAAVPALESTREDHCLVRALTERSAARELTGDLAGALADARRLAVLTRRWQLDQVGRLASQVISRADLQGVLGTLQEQATRLAHDVGHDPVTGLHSRHWWERRVGDLTAADGAIALAVLDLDCFKDVNDRFGHQVGDRVLATVGRVLVAGVPVGGEVARLGGDEFVLLLPGASLVDMTSWAERIRRAAAEHPWDEVAEGLRLTLSVGTATGPAAAVQHVLARADAALLRAKRAGRDRVV